MFGFVRKRMRMNNFEYQSLRDVVKEGREDVIERFEKMFKEMKVYGNRKSIAGILYTESEPDRVPETYYTESVLETMYMGIKSKVRKRFQRQGSYQRGQVFDI